MVPIVRSSRCPIILYSLHVVFPTFKSKNLSLTTLWLRVEKINDTTLKFVKLERLWYKRVDICKWSRYLSKQKTLLMWSIKNVRESCHVVIYHWIFNKTEGRCMSITVNSPFYFCLYITILGRKIYEGSVNPSDLFVFYMFCWLQI